MNFFLHHHLARRDLARPESAIAAMLPDVWRMADRRAHLRRADVDDPIRNDPAHAALQQALAEGVAHHVAADAHFHGAPELAEGEREARMILLRAPAAPKMSLLAHVAWELCLDGALLRRVGLASALEGIRDGLNHVRPNGHHRLAAMHVRLPPQDREAFDARVDRLLDAITAGPWAAAYTTGAGVTECLERIRSRLRLEPLSPGDRRVVAEGFDAAEPLADAQVALLMASPALG